LGPKVKTLIRIGLAAGMLMAGIFPTVAHASDPSDAAITLHSIHAFRNTAIDGDMVVIFHWQWTSDNNSSLPASSTILLEYVSENGTILASAIPYVFPLFDDNGYGQAVNGFYLSSNETWGEASVLRIKGLASIFQPPFAISPPLFEYTLQSADYSASTAQDDSWEEIQTYILQTIDILKTVYTDVTLKTGSTLSDYGEAYFESTIPGLLQICPILFNVQVVIPTTMAVTPYDMSLQSQYSGRLEGTDLERGANRLGDKIGVSGSVIWGLLTFVACTWLTVWLTKRKNFPIEACLVVSTGIVTGMAVLIGDLIFTVSLVGALVATIGISWALLGKRA